MRVSAEIGDRRTHDGIARRLAAAAHVPGEHRHPDAQDFGPRHALLLIELVGQLVGFERGPHAFWKPLHEFARHHRPENERDADTRLAELAETLSAIAREEPAVLVHGAIANVPDLRGEQLLLHELEVAVVEAARVAQVRIDAHRIRELTRPPRFEGGAGTRGAASREP